MSASTTTPVPAVTAPPRRTPWPYAALVSGLATGAATMFLASAPSTFEGAPSPMTTAFLADNLNDAAVVQFGGTLALVGVVASLVFLLGLTRFHARHARPRSAGPVEALRWCSVAFVSTGTIGAAMHYIAAGGAPGGIDQAFYSVEASATIAVLADQLSFATFLPGLAVMTVVGLLALRDRVFPPAVGVVALLLAAASTAATVVLGLPYSAGLVWPLFALVVGITGLLSRRAA